MIWQHDLVLQGQGAISERLRSFSIPDLSQVPSSQSAFAKPANQSADPRTQGSGRKLTHKPSILFHQKSRNNIFNNSTIINMDKNTFPDNTWSLLVFLFFDKGVLYNSLIPTFTGRLMTFSVPGYSIFMKSPFPQIVSQDPL